MEIYCVTSPTFRSHGSRRVTYDDKSNEDLHRIIVERYPQVALEIPKVTKDNRHMVAAFLEVLEDGKGQDPR